jgi:hypothetical protein
MCALCERSANERPARDAGTVAYCGSAHNYASINSLLGFDVLVVGNLLTMNVTIGTVTRGRAARTGMGLFAGVLLLAGLAGCSRKTENDPPVATPGFTAVRTRAALGSPLEVTYKFVVASGAKIDGDYRVFVHFLNSDEEQMWTDDHEPPRSTSTWKPGETIQYTRTVFVPIYPYIGKATVRMGLYNPKDGRRLPLTGGDAQQRAYAVGTLELLPQSENVFLIFKDGWHAAEVAQDNGAVEWQWSKKAGTIAFRNPKRDVWFYLNVDGKPAFLPQPQQVTVRIGEHVVDQFTLNSAESIIRKTAISAAQLGTADTVEIVVDAGTSFVPAQTAGANSGDPRELGVRVFHAFVEPKS